MADSQKPKLSVFPLVPSSDAVYSRRLNGLFGTKSMIGRSIRRIMDMSGISSKEEKGSSEVSEAGDIVDRTASEQFIQESERALREYAGTQRDPQDALRQYQAMIVKCRENPGSQESMDAMVGLLKFLKETKGITSNQSRDAFQRAIAKAPTIVTETISKASRQQGQQRRA